MKIGIDFDNTIIDYNEVFFKYAMKMGLIPANTPRNKIAVRDHIRKQHNGNDQWTELQGFVYGVYIHEAKPALNIAKFFEICEQLKIEFTIISHKTIYPARGPQVNLRENAQQWVRSCGISQIINLDSNQIVFTDSLSSKIKKIKSHRCNYFIDDMIEVFKHPAFPKEVKKILYSSECRNDEQLDIINFDDWNDIGDFLHNELLGT